MSVDYTEAVTVVVLNVVCTYLRFDDLYDDVYIFLIYFVRIHAHVVQCTVIIVFIYYVCELSLGDIQKFCVCYNIVRTNLK